MTGPPLGPGGEDITWIDQVAPRGERRLVPAKSNLQPRTSNLKPSLRSLGPEVSIHGNLILQTPVQELFVRSVRPVMGHPVLVQYFGLRRHFDSSEFPKEASSNQGWISLAVAHWGHIIRLLQHIPDGLIRAYTGFRFRQGVLLEAHTHLTEARRKEATGFTVIRCALDGIRCGVVRERTAVIMYTVMQPVDLQQQIITLPLFLHVLW